MEVKASNKRTSRFGRMFDFYRGKGMFLKGYEIGFTET
jgi:hypothetical protein